MYIFLALYERRGKNQKVFRNVLYTAQNRTPCTAWCTLTVYMPYCDNVLVTNM